MKKRIKKIPIQTKNVKILRLYKNYCKNAKGYSDKTWTKILKAIVEYSNTNSGEDFAKFNHKRAEKFREDLIKKGIKLSTVKCYLRHLRGFFIWLTNQAGYKKSINREHIEYLTLTRAQAEMATVPQREDYPTFEMVLQVINSIDVSNEIGQRNQAMICIVLLTGIRVAALISLPLKCFDASRLRISQDANQGVKTKRRKTFNTYLLPIDKTLIQYVLNWYNYLVEVKHFPQSAPLFPKAKREILKDSSRFVYKNLEPEFWKNTQSVDNIFKTCFEQAGFKPYTPHAIRHTLNNLTKQVCHYCNMEEFQAISQNFGHSSIKTTFQSYGKLSDDRLGEIISTLSFDKNENDNREVEYSLKKILKICGRQRINNSH